MQRLELYLKRKWGQAQDQDETSERQLHLLLEVEPPWEGPQDVTQGEVPQYRWARQGQKVRKRADSHSNRRQKSCRRERLPITTGTYRKDFLENNLLIWSQWAHCPRLRNKQQIQIELVLNFSHTCLYPKILSTQSLSICIMTVDWSLLHLQLFPQSLFWLSLVKLTTCEEYRNYRKDIHHKEPGDNTE